MAKIAYTEITFTLETKLAASVRAAATAYQAEEHKACLRDGRCDCASRDFLSEWMVAKVCDGLAPTEEDWGRIMCAAEVWAGRPNAGKPKKRAPSRKPAASHR